MLKLIIMRLYKCLLFKTNKYAHVPQTERRARKRQTQLDSSCLLCVLTKYGLDQVAGSNICSICGDLSWQSVDLAAPQQQQQNRLGEEENPYIIGMRLWFHWCLSSHCLSYPTLHVALSTTNWLRSEWSSLQLPFSCSSSRVFRVRLSDSLSACRRTYAALTTNLHSRRLAKATSRLDFNYNNSNFDFEPSRGREWEKERGRRGRRRTGLSPKWAISLCKSRCSRQSPS